MDEKYINNDSLFKNACRHHQAWYREQVLQLAMGENPRTHRAKNESEEDFLVRKRTVKDIAHLTDKDAADLMNFIPQFHSEIRKAMKDRYGKIPTSHDLMNDMLRSENIPWNIFVPMLSNEYAVVSVLKTITQRENIAKIIDWKIEYNPKTLGDNTAFDAFIKYSTDDEKIGVVGFEVKYTEEGYNIHDREWDRINDSYSSYSIVTRNSGCFIQPDTFQFSSPEFIQIWRNHMLAISMGMKYDYLYDSVTIYPSGNTHFHPEGKHIGALELYKDKLTAKGVETYHYISYEDLFSLFESAYHEDREFDWVRYLRQRYIVNNEDYIPVTNNNMTKNHNMTTENNLEDSKPLTCENIEHAAEKGQQEWVLNLVEYSLEEMFNTGLARARYFSEAPITSMEVSKDVAGNKYRALEQFKNDYNAERGSTHDSKNCAYWYFCREVKTGDIIYLAKGPELYGYAIVKGDEVRSDKINKEHCWDVEWHKFEKAMMIDANIATPFFVNLQIQKNKRRVFYNSIDQQVLPQDK